MTVIQFDCSLNKHKTEPKIKHGAHRQTQHQNAQEDSKYTQKGIWSLAGTWTQKEKIKSTLHEC